MEKELDEIFMHFIPNGMSKKDAKKKIMDIYQTVCDEADSLYNDMQRALYDE
jgi:hypothetical protein